MSNAAILSPHLSDRGTVTVSSAVETLPGSHLLTQNAWQLWRAEENFAQIIIDFGATVSLNAGAIIGMNHTATAEWRWRYAANVAGLSSPSQILDWTVIDAAGPPDARLFPNRRAFLQFEAVSCGALSIEIEDYDNPDPLEAWRIMAGALFQPAGNIDLELSRPFVSADAQVGRYSGGTITGARGRVHGFAADWSNLTRAEADTLRDIATLRGNWGDGLFVLDPAAPTRLQRDSVLGPFVAGTPDVTDIPLWPGSGPDLQMSRASVRVMEGNA
jgi:hypothetical protein